LSNGEKTKGNKMKFLKNDLGGNEVRLRRPKFPFIWRLRPMTNVVMLLDMGHTLRGEHAQEG
jgi:hypothetical protein